MKTFTGFIAFLLMASTALAAQVGQVVVDQAQVYEYPQFASKVISNLKKGLAVQVSNLPTEGFYKVRLSNGELGWISGNDVLVGGGGQVPSYTTPQPPRKQNPYTKPRSYAEEEAAGDEEEGTEDSGAHDKSRFLVGYGLQSLSYAGLGNAFSKSETLNYGTNLGLEGQFKSSPNFYWGIRLDYLSTSTGDQILSSGTTQTMKESHLAITGGPVYSLIQSRSFRLAVAGYLGLAKTSLVVTQVPTSGTGGENNYSGWNFLGMAFLQPSISIGSRFAIFGEVGYRYERTASFASDLLGTVTIPAFQIDYSGVIGRFGVEMRF